MNMKHLIESAIFGASSGNEGRPHILLKTDIAKMIDNPGCEVILSDAGTGTEVRLGAGYQCAVETGWPMVMPQCTYESYRIMRGVSPEYIFDIGVFRDLALVGVVEITNKGSLGQSKVDGVLRRGMWLAEITVSGAREAMTQDRIGGIFHLQCGRVVTP